MPSDCSGNIAGDFRESSLEVRCKAYNELSIAVYVANICMHVLVSWTIGKASGIGITSSQPKVMDYTVASHIAN